MEFELLLRSALLLKRLPPADVAASGHLLHRFELRLALCQLLAQGEQVHLGFAGCGKHAAGALLLFYVVLDHFAKHIDFGSEVIIRRAGALDFCDELFGTVVLDFGFVMNVLVLRRFEKGRIKDLFFDGSVQT